MYIRGVGSERMVQRQSERRKGSDKWTAVIEAGYNTRRTYKRWEEKFPSLEREAYFSSPGHSKVSGIKGHETGTTHFPDNA